MLPIRQRNINLWQKNQWLNKESRKSNFKILKKILSHRKPERVLKFKVWDHWRQSGACMKTIFFRVSSRMKGWSCFHELLKPSETVTAKCYGNPLNCPKTASNQKRSYNGRRHRPVVLPPWQSSTTYCYWTNNEAYIRNYTRLALQLLLFLIINSAKLSILSLKHVFRMSRLPEVG